MSHKINDVLKSWNPQPKKRQEIKAKNGNNFTALHFWLGTGDFIQQDNIRSGMEIQKFIEFIAKKSPVKLEIIKNTTLNIPGVGLKEADILFRVDSENKTIIYYREVKGNTNLDSEKKAANKEKIVQIKKYLEKEYPDAIINSACLCPAWLDSEKGIEGLNDFIQLLGYDPLSPEEHVELGKAIGLKIREALRMSN